MRPAAGGTPRPRESHEGRRNERERPCTVGLASSPAWGSCENHVTLLAGHVRIM